MQPYSTEGRRGSRIVSPVEVEAYSGYTHAERPRRVRLGGRWVQVRLLRAWREPEARWFLVEAGSERLRLRYDLEEQRWYLVS